MCTRRVTSITKFSTWRVRPDVVFFCPSVMGVITQTTTREPSKARSAVPDCS